MQATERRLVILLVLMFLGYAFVRLMTNQSAQENPRELVDTAAYFRVSQQPITDVRFWGDKRPLVFPLLLKISAGDFPRASLYQVVFSIFAWGLLACFVSASMRTVRLRLASFGLILALSLVRHLANWEYVMMTESLSVSWFVLFLALGIWLVHGWRADKVIALCAAGLFLAFTRDTNAYLLLMLAGMLTLAALFRWVKPRVLIPAAFFLFTFLLNNYNSDIGERWVFPMHNLVGRRILLSSAAVTYLESCGMPVSPALLGMANNFGHSQDSAFYNDPELEDYRIWLLEDGKTCYMKYLLTNPARSLRQAWVPFQQLIAFQDVDKYFAAQYDPILPWFIEPFIYPVNFIPFLWVGLTVAALFALWQQAWTSNPLWGIFILLDLPILPHLFITWHGDAMAPERHALSVGLQIALCFWLLIFLWLDQFIVQRRPAQMNTIKTPNSFQRFMHRIAMLRPVSAALAVILYRVDNAMLKISGGRRTLSELFLPMVQITTIGAKSGEPRTMPLAGLIDGDKIILIGSNFGQKHNPSWYYNLKATPQCTVLVSGRTGVYIAREAQGEERERYWKMAVSVYMGFDMYRIRASHRTIPVMILEQVK